MSNFADRLADSIRGKNSRICVGLDPWPELLPPEFAAAVAAGADEAAAAYVAFCCQVVDAVAAYAAAVKPQAAFFEALGPSGYKALWDVMAYARSQGCLVILDAKRSDIGSTAKAYADAYFRPRAPLLGPDAITISAYLGSDGVLPFVEAAEEVGGGVYVLVKTSNPSTTDLQDLLVTTATGKRRAYLEMARLTASWGLGLVGECGYSSVGAVVGATHPEQLSDLRTWQPRVPFLVPGYGAQGGEALDVVGAFDADGQGAVVSSSRGVLYAYREPPYASRYGAAKWAEAAGAAAMAMRDEINAVLGK